MLIKFVNQGYHLPEFDKQKIFEGGMTNYNGDKLIENLMNMLQSGSSSLILLAALAIGVVHAFEPDHLAAITTQIIKKGDKKSKSAKYFVRKSIIKSSLMGALWGAGHTSSVLVLGLLVAGLSLTISDNFFRSIELIVGLMLLLLGTLLIFNKGILRNGHVHPHRHEDGIVHTHSHGHDADHRHGHKSYLIGCIQGLAGSGVLVVLGVSGLGSFEMAISFLAVFGIGSIIGMTIASGIIGIPFVLSFKTPYLHKFLRYVIAFITIVMGASIILEITFNSGLF